MEEPNYRELLKKYIKHVLQIESVSYLENGCEMESDVFTDKEWATMRALDKEVRSLSSGSVDVMDGWNDGESDAEYCTNRFG